MNENPYRAPESVLEVPLEDDSRQFYIVSKKKFAILFFLTMGLYTVYWFYKNWKEYKISSGTKIWPIPRAIFAIFFTHSLFRKVEAVLINKGSAFNWDPRTLATAYVVLAIVSHILDKMSMNEIGTPVTDLLSMAILPVLYIPLSKAQDAINVSQGDPEGENNATLTIANFAWIVLGALFWLIVIFGFLVVFGLVDAYPV